LDLKEASLGPHARPTQIGGEEAMYVCPMKCIKSDIN
jgi:hypothetical protein